jgi:hypothetical protein
MRTNTKARPSAQATKRSIPSPTAPGYLSVADGTETVGSIVVRDADFFAFANTALIGKFPTLTAAMRAIPSGIAAPDDDGRPGLDLTARTSGLPRSISTLRPDPKSVGTSKSVGSKVPR